MEIFIVKNKENWPKQSFFTQEWEWGEVLERDGEEVERMAVKDDQIVATAQVVYRKLPFGWPYAFCPKGPIFVGQQSSEAYKLLLAYLRKKNCVFFRCEPTFLPKEIKAGKVKDVNPSHTYILDLRGSDLMSDMKKNTRYCIRLAERQNLRIVNEKNLAVFWALMQKTMARDNFSTHHKKHYESVLEHTGVLQLTAYLDRIPVASAFFLGAGDTFTYLFAASDYTYHKLSASYILQWEAIQLAKKLGYKFYDFFGVAPGVIKDGEYVYDHKHRYAGITKFKLGFGGAHQASLGTFDIILDKKKYWFYKTLRFVYGIFKISRSRRAG